MDRLALGLYLAEALHRAALTLPQMTPAELYERFLSWIMLGNPQPLIPGRLKA